MRNKKIVVVLLSLMMLVGAAFGFVSCEAYECSHKWTDATCTTVKTCSLCGETEGELLDHKWEGGSCTESKTCALCGAKDGVTPGHTWVDATCDEAKHCSVCDAKEGAKLDHTGGTATCTQKAVCTLCNTEYGTVNADNHTATTFKYETNGDGTHKKLYACCNGLAATEDCSGGTATCTQKAVCTVCNTEYGSLKEHDYEGSSVWKSDNSGHWKKCNDCTAEDVEGKGSHVPGAAATETTAQTCTVCSYIVMPATGHITHTPRADWAYDDTNHWYECTGCEDQEFNKGVHNFDNDCDTTCNTCDYVRTITHNYEKKYSATEHWEECSVCHADKSQSRGAHEGGTATCNESKVCTVCENSYGTTDSTNHEKNTYIYTTNGDGTHKKIHECCNEVEVANEDCTGTAATCTEKAYCNVCESSYGTTDSTNHEKNTYIYTTNGDGTHKKIHECCNEVEVANEDCTGTAATCKVAAYCNVCESSYGTTDSTNHEKNTYIYTTNGDGTHKKIHECCNEVEVANEDCTGTAATCEVAAYCNVCESSYGAPNGHDLKAATCTESKACKDCPYTEGEPLGHNMKAATCDEPSSCTRCPYTEGEPAEHEKVAATCIKGEYCSKCGKTFGDPKGHSVGTNGTAATCKEPAKCGTCGESFGGVGACDFTAETVALAYLKTSATCDDAAVYYRSCTVCYVKDTNEENVFTNGSALDHDYGDWTIEVVDGVSVHKRVCGNDATHIESANCAVGETGEAATCEKPATCGVCGSEFGSALGHVYGEPVVTTAATCTTNGETTATCTNGCGSTKKEVIYSQGHKYNQEGYEDVVTSPTCTTEGYTTHTCSVCQATQKDNYVAAHGHAWLDATCTTAKYCPTCDTTEGASLGHDWVVDADNCSAATCEEKEVVAYKCDRGICDATYTEEVGDVLPHNVEGVTPELVLKDGETCIYVQHYACNDCEDGVVIGKEVAKHEYKAEITKPATCVEEGEKTTKCTKCYDESKSDEENIDAGALKVDPIDKDMETGHVWGEGVTADGVTTYTCTRLDCGATKETVVIDSETAINTENLANKELVLGEDTNIKMDEAAAAGMADKNVTINVGNKTKEELEATDGFNLTDEQKQQIGDNPVYNFTITDTATDKPITQFGEEAYVTVTLPYVLGEGENVDDIAVWYIDGEGKLTSIKATFNFADPSDPNNRNGFVTFKTNHFSYYTVTRLTPKERCNLYGHNEKVTTLEVTCTTDGYELHYCVRCGNSEKKKIVTALGHDYGEEPVVTAATCIAEGSALYTCQREGCGYSYTVKIDPINHNYVELEGSRTPATCISAGSVVYVCENECGSTYTEILAQSGHALTEEVVAPTCTTNGYTLHGCSNEGCTYSYIDNEISAIGHDYELAFNWGEEYKSAGVTIRCKNDVDGNHTESYDNLEIVVQNTPPSCVSDGKIEYIVRITFNGEVYEDKQTLISYADQLNHKYSNVVSYDEVSHWHACINCGTRGNEQAHENNEPEIIKEATCYAEGAAIRSCACGYVEHIALERTEEHSYASTYSYDANAHWTECVLCRAKGNENVHAFGEGEIVLAASCAQAGEIKYVCATCQYTKVESIPATGEHTYVDGACSHCGKEETACTHEATREFLLDLTEYGACMESLRCATCDCGEVIYVIDPEMLFEGGCDMEEGEEDYGEMENGEWYSMEAICSTCGLYMYIYAEERSDGCIWVAYYEITLKMGDTVILDKAIYEDADYDHSTSRVEFPLDSACGTTMIVYQCDDCGEITIIYDMDMQCSMGEPTYVETTDDKGIVHYFEIMECPDCGLILETETYVEVLSVCESISYMIGRVYLDGELLATIEDESWNDEHEWTREYELLGDTCEDGYRVINSCDKCGSSSSYRSEGHRYTYTRVDFSEYTSCGGYYEGYACELCGLFIDIYNGEMNCEFGEEEPEIVETVENGVTILRAQMTCIHCGLIATEEMGTWVVSECITGVYMEMRLETADTVIFRYRETREEGAHAYEYTYSFNNGVDCAAGGSYSATCSVCGDTKESRFYEHDYIIEERISLAEKGGCEGYLIIKRCPCGINGSIDYETDCNMEHMSQSYPDENGITHQVNARICRECGLTIVDDYYYEYDANCQQYRISTRAAGIGDEVFCSFTNREYYGFSHQWSYTYDFGCGVDCDGGENCSVGGHNCENGFMMSGVCTNCGETDDSGKVFYSHQRMSEQIDLSTYGVCGGGFIQKYSCPCGKESGVNWYNSSCRMQWVSDYSYEVDGVSHYVYVEQCRECGFTRTSDSYEIREGCYGYHYANRIYEINDAVIIEGFGSEGRSSYHKNTYVYTFDGEENCESGVSVTATCSVCSEITQEYWTSHNTVRHEVSLTEYGTCGGSVSYYVCPCGQETYNFNRNYACENMQYISGDSGRDENGYYWENYTEKCLTCGLTIVRSSYYEKIGCYVYRSESYLLTVGETTILDYTNRYQSDTQHDFTYVYDFGCGVDCDGGESCPNGGHNCENGVRITGECSVCDESYDTTWYYHETMRTRYDLSEYSSCGGYIEVRECPCGNSGYVNRNFNYTSYTSNEYVEDGKLYRVENYYCEECGLTYSHRYYTERDANTCTATDYYTVTVDIHGSLILATSYQNTYSSHDFITTGTLVTEGTTCNEGVIISNQCKDCGYGDSYTVYHHEQYEVNRYNLQESGAQCIGSLIEYTCACGQNRHTEIDSQCDFDNQGTDMWIEGYVWRSTAHAARPWNSSYGYDAYLRICAQTDPVACGYTIRYARYYLFQEGTCYAYEYETYQLGYNRETGEYVEEITIPTGSKFVYHTYVETDLYEEYENGNTKVSGTRYDCSVCGSYYYGKYSYNEEGNCVSYERLFINTLNDNARKEYRETRRYDEVTGNCTYEENYYVEADGRIWGNRTERVTTNLGAAPAPFTGNVILYSETRTNFDGDTQTSYGFEYQEAGYEGVHAGVTYYRLYEKRTEEDGSWYTRTFTYDFSGPCTRTIAYENSNGVTETMTEDVCYSPWGRTIKESTCSQPGLIEWYCPICDYVHSTEEIRPEHSWYQVDTNFYYCTRCGLENVNGASGSITMEDLTAQYGGGENYVIGYWVDTGVQFGQYVALYLRNPAEGQDPEVLIDVTFIQLDEVCAIAFSKAEVLAAAESLGLTADTYDVRFVFVPEYADGSFDYAITLTEDVEVTELSGSQLVKLNVPLESEKIIAITPTVSGDWTITALTDRYEILEIRDESGKQIYYWSGYGQIGISYWLEAGSTYQFRIYNHILNDEQNNYIYVDFMAPQA